MLPGDPLYFQIGVEVVDDGSNAGLATIVYDVISFEAMAEKYQLAPLTPAASGYDRITGTQTLRNVTEPMYVPVNSGSTVGYYGGWGFDTAGLPTGGNVTDVPGMIGGAVLAAPLTWTADTGPVFAGLQPKARLGVGQGTYTFPADDLHLAGLQGGFGQRLSNLDNIIEGDGTWLMQEGVIDTSGWLPQTYNFGVNPTVGAVFDPTLDYSQDMGGGFRVNVPAQEMAGASFSFTLVPAPAGLVMLLAGGLGLLRRRGS
jgi:hypothetical protein